MKHIPYGYEIVDGKAVINEEEAEQVRGFFKEYIKGLSLTSAAKKVGLNIYHGSAGRMLKNKYYLGTEFYPKIVDR
ncbi:MAG: recombinase, partial [Anaerotignaceae bacterium]